MIAAFKRLRQTFAAVRLFLSVYEGARFSIDRSRLNSPLQDVRVDYSQSSREILQGKARYFARNNAIFNRCVDLFETYVSGSGIPVALESSSQAWNEAGQKWLRVWERYSDIESLQGFATQVGMIVRSWFVDGEVFVIAARGKGGTPRCQVIEAHRCKTPPSMASQEGKTIVDGIGVDADGRPMTYYFIKPDGKSFELVPADSVYHLFEPSRPGQKRAEPFCTPVINELHDLDDLHLLEMKAAKVAARIAVINKTKSGDAPNVDKLLRDAMRVSTKTNTGADSTESRNDYYLSTLGGDSVTMRPGDEITSMAGNRPSVVTVDYFRYKTELVCAGIGIPYVLVFPDSMQGTVYRGSLEMAGAFFDARFQVLRGFLQWMYEKVLLWAKSNVKELRAAPEDWYLLSFRAPKGPDVDIGRNSAAMLAELAVGATNYEHIYGPLGLDWREEFRKLKAQQDYAAELGLTMVAPPKPEPTVVGAEGDSQDDAEDDAEDKTKDKPE